MLDVTRSLPEDPAELRAFTALLLIEMKAQAVLIESEDATEELEYVPGRSP